MYSLDKKDLKILDLLQQDATLQVTEIAETVGLSRTPCWRRIRELEKSGYIRKRVALLDRNRLGVPISVFVAVKTNQHNAKWLGQFRAAVNALPEIVEAYRLTHPGQGHRGLRQGLHEAHRNGRLRGCEFQLLDGGAQIHDSHSAGLMRQPCTRKSTSSTIRTAPCHMVPTR